MPANAPSEAQAACVLQVCGRLVVISAGRRVEHMLPGRLGRLLFVYLVLNRARDTPKAVLVDALWPGTSPTGVDLTLRTLLSKTRRATAFEIEVRAGGYRLLLPSEARIDIEAAADAIHRAESAIESDDWSRAWGPSQVALFIARRGFLEGEEARWIDDWRRSLAEIELRALECYAAACAGVGGPELPSAERAARQLVLREPFRESGHRILMRTLAGRGNIAQALIVYDELATRLREALGVDPSPATRHLHRELLHLT